MRIWKIVSGILSIAISLFVVFQSFFAGLLNILTSNGQSSGTAGLVVAIMLLTAGIVSIATHNGSRGGDIAVAVLCGIGTLVGFLGAGSYTDLYIWALWCLLCAAIAMIDFAITSQYQYEDDDEEEEIPEPPPMPKGKRTPVPFQAVILERDPKKRDAVIDALPERQAKNYLKQALNVLVPRQAVSQADDNDDLIKILVAILVVLGVFVVGAVCVGIFMSMPKNEQTVSSAPPSVSTGVQQSETPLQASEPAQPAQGDSRYSVGESVISNDVIITLMSVTESQGSSFLTPGNGKTFVLCEFDIENNSDQDIAISSILSFSAYVDNYTTGLSISAMSSSDKSQLDGTIAAGRKMNGVIGYEVDADWSEIEIRFTADFWNRNEIIFAYNKSA